MDLGTVRKKLKDKKYNTVGDVLEDLQLIWNNCKTYNSKGCEIWKIAHQLEKQTAKLAEKYLKFSTKESKKQDDIQPKPKESFEKRQQDPTSRLKPQT